MNLPTLAPLLALLLAAPLHAATPVDQTHPLAADAVIEVENVAGRISVRGSPRGDLRITGSLGEGVKGLLVEGDARRLRVKVDYPRSIGGGWWGGGVRGDSVLELELPQGVQLKVESVSASIDVSGLSGRRVELQSVSGSIDFAGAPAAIEIESVSGDIEVQSQGIREVSLESVSGRLTLTGSVGERLSAESVSGTIRLQPDGPLKSLQVSAVSGGIDLRAALAPAGRLSAESLSGALTVVLPRSTSARVQASSFSGAIKSDVGTVEKESFGPGSSLKTTLGEGEGQVRLESFSGTLRLRLE
jgi:hypothetical protein